MKISIPEQSKNLQTLSEKAVKELTTAFMGLMYQLKSEKISPETMKQFEQLYKQTLGLNREYNSQLNNIVNGLKSIDRNIEKLRQENKRLETLYSSGISFSIETEKHSLLQKAMDIVEKELKANAGYIVLIDTTGKVTDLIGRNMSPDEEQVANDLSTTVIQSTISHSQPTQVEDTDKDDLLSRRTSILHLDIKSTLCVPLILDSKVMGAVYLDRRNKANPFTEEDLAFLISFGRQIVRGLNVSKQLEILEDRLIADATMTLASLRATFHCPYIIGSSPPVFEMLRLASRIAPTDAAALVLGESGTGKELIARAIHENSQRPDGPFIAINCGAIPGDLLESELFGYEKGAFTGASKSKPGKIEIADGGTLFLDEIAEMDIRLQAKLLRVLQSKEIVRVGSVTPKKLNIRIIAATNQNIPQLIAEKRFREDLYYRLKVIELIVPPLRKRYGDVQELAEFFLQKFSPETHFELSDDVLDILEAYHWPGNIRELENVMQRCAVLAKGGLVQKVDLPSDLLTNTELPKMEGNTTLKKAEEDFRRQHVQKILRKTTSKSEAAKVLGVNRTYLYKILEELGLS